MASLVDFLSEYFHRNLCESCFSADKGRFGSVVRQKREDRQHTALSQTPYSTTSMLSELTQNSFVPMPINEKDLIALFIELICYKKKEKTRK